MTPGEIRTAVIAQAVVGLLLLAVILAIFYGR